MTPKDSGGNRHDSENIETQGQKDGQTDSVQRQEARGEHAMQHEHTAQAPRVGTPRPVSTRAPAKVDLAATSLRAPAARRTPSPSQPEQPERERAESDRTWQSYMRLGRSSEHSSLDKVRRENRHLQRQVSELTAKVNEMNAVAESLREQVELSQRQAEASFKLASKRGPDIMDDGDIKSQLANIYGSIRNFASEWYDKSRADWTGDGLPVLTPATLLIDHTGPLQPWKSAEVGRILLEKSLSVFVCDNMMTRPFEYLTAAFSRTETGQLIRSKQKLEDERVDFDLERVAVSMHRIYNGLLAYDEPSAHAFRGRSAEFIQSSGKYVGSLGSRAKAAYQRKCDLQYRTLAVDFYSDHTELLVKRLSHGEVTRLQQDLMSIFAHVGSLFPSLWATQHYIKIIHSPYELGEFFRDSNELVVPHPRLYVEDESLGMKDARISLVINPAIIAHGSAHGENLNAYKVWRPATVWLDLSDRCSRHESVDVPMADMV